MDTWLFIVLLVGHWAGDYTQLSTPKMLAAKKFGKPLFPILNHACLHGLLTIPGLLIFNSRMAFFGALIMVGSHFLIDLWKGRMNVWFPSLQNPANVYHWWVFGADQTFHILILVLISSLS